MRAYNLVTARLLARKGIVDPTDFTSIFAWRLEKRRKEPNAPSPSNKLGEAVLGKLKLS